MERALPRPVHQSESLKWARWVGGANFCSEQSKAGQRPASESKLLLRETQARLGWGNSMRPQGILFPCSHSKLPAHLTRPSSPASRAWDPARSPPLPGLPRLASPPTCGCGTSDARTLPHTSLLPLFSKVSPAPKLSRSYLLVLRLRFQPCAPHLLYREDTGIPACPRPPRSTLFQPFLESRASGRRTPGYLRALGAAPARPSHPYRFPGGALLQQPTLVGGPGLPSLPPPEPRPRTELPPRSAPRSRAGRGYSLNRLSRQSAVQPRGIPGPARAPLRTSILPAPLARRFRVEDAARPAAQTLSFPPPGPGGGGGCVPFSPPPSVVLAGPAPLLQLPWLVPKAEDVGREAGVAVAVEAKKGGGLPAAGPFSTFY